MQIQYNNMDFEVLIYLTNNNKMVFRELYNPKTLNETNIFSSQMITFELNIDYLSEETGYEQQALDFYPFENNEIAFNCAN